MTGSRGFTLVEMIVALAVTSVLTVLMLRMFTDSSAIWKREDDRLDTFREARAALQLMARELATVNPMPGVNPTLGGTEQFPVLALRYHPDTLEAEKTTPGNQQIYALASLPYQPKKDTKTGEIRDRGELRAIGYFCAWVQEKNCYVLRRQSADSDETFSRLQRVLKAASPMQYPASFGVLYDRTAPANSATTPVEPIQDVATYIWDLQFALPTPPATPENPTPLPPRWLDQKIYARELPEWVEIRFRALGSNAARNLEGQNLNQTHWFNTSDVTYQKFILPGEQQFVTRVKLNR